MNLIKENNGAALVMTLLIITTLTALAIGFSRESGIELNLSGYYRDSQRSYNAAYSGISFALYLLGADQDRDVDSLEDRWSHFSEISFPSPLPSDMSFRGRIEDENSKMNVNSLLDAKGEIDPAAELRLRILFNALELPENMSDSLLDWLDPDDIKRLDGAESYYYRGLDIPYDCGNFPLETIRQIFLIKGFKAYAQQEGENRLLHYITVINDGKVNINTASEEVIRSLHEELDAIGAENILQQRSLRPFSSTDQLKEFTGIKPDLFEKIKDLITVKSDIFSIEVEGQCNESLTRIQAFVHREAKAINIVYWRVL